MSEAAAHGHAHGEHRFLAHHFANMDRQVDASRLGMWLFLSTEILLFVGLFTAYSVYRYSFPQAWA
ncbi:MAG: cytochrome c oxidase subunit 3 family protein, partial [Myxococcales bacterium]